MICFNHANRAAIGTCKGCSKALCHECAVDLGLGLACRNLHEEHVEQLNTLVTRNITAEPSSKKPLRVRLLFAIALTIYGAAMLISSIVSDFASVLLTFGGAVLFVGGCQMLLKYWRDLRAKPANMRPNA